MPYTISGTPSPQFGNSDESSCSSPDEYKVYDSEHDLSLQNLLENLSISEPLDTEEKKLEEAFLKKIDILINKIRGEDDKEIMEILKKPKSNFTEIKKEINYYVDSECSKRQKQKPPLEDPNYDADSEEGKFGVPQKQNSNNTNSKNIVTVKNNKENKSCNLGKQYAYFRPSKQPEEENNENQLTFQLGIQHGAS